RDMPPEREATTRAVTDPLHPGPASDAVQGPRGHLLEAHDRRAIGRDQLDHLVEVRPAARRIGLAVEEIPGTDDHPFTVERVRVLLADPPAYTPWYDHELATALAAAGAEVEVATTRFRFGELPPAAGYRRSERFYPLSSRLRGR